MIIFSPQVKSVITAALLAKIHHDTAFAKTEQTNIGLFYDQSRLDADILDFKETILTYTALFGHSLDWLDQAPGLQFKRLIQLNLRHNSPDFSLILRVVNEALQFGPQYCLQCVSTAARKFTNRANTVQREIHRMLGFIRFVPMNEHTLVAKPLLFHQTADLILRRFAGRYPDSKLVLVLDNCALCLFRHQLKKEGITPYLPYLQDKEAEELWRRYYQSQYINTRKNIPLAQHHIPQKYWDWLTEGKILKTEKGEHRD